MSNTYTPKHSGAEGGMSLAAIEAMDRRNNRRIFMMLAVILLIGVLAGAIKVPGVGSFVGDLPDVTTQEAVLEQPAPVEIRVELLPETIECRAIIKAVVPVQGEKKHKVLGVTVRTDKGGMTAQGDLDVCVRADSTIIEQTSTGMWHVRVPADDFVFHRPRVDTVLTRESVWYSEGFLGDVFGIFPWVSDNEGLTPAAFAHAQLLIGSSKCIAVAWNDSVEAIRDSYLRQAEERGIDPSTVSVEIIGEPDFRGFVEEIMSEYTEGQRRELAEFKDEYNLSVEEADVRCLREFAGPPIPETTPTPGIDLFNDFFDTGGEQSQSFSNEPVAEDQGMVPINPVGVTELEE